MCSVFLMFKSSEVSFFCGNHCGCFWYGCCCCGGGDLGKVENGQEKPRNISMHGVHSEMKSELSSSPRTPNSGQPSSVGSKTDINEMSL